MSAHRTMQISSETPLNWKTVGDQILDDIEISIAEIQAQTEISGCGQPCDAFFSETKPLPNFHNVSGTCVDELQQGSTFRIFTRKCLRSRTLAILHDCCVLGQ